MRRLAVISTHPIQYYAPLFSMLSDSNINLMVFYTWGKSSIKKHDPGFDQVVEWDIPILQGYPYTFLENTSNNPGSSHYFGIRNPTLISDIENFGPDAILIYGWAYHSHLKAMRYFKGRIPVWFRGDSTILDLISPVKKVLRKMCLTWVYKHVDLAFYVGTQNKKYYNFFGLKESQLVFAPHAVDNNRFELASTADPMLIRRELDIPEDHIVVLFVGKLESIKSPKLLLSAFLSCNQHNTHLIFVGDGKLKSELQALVANNNRIYFLGFKNQALIPLYYSACDLFCLPSDSETWGLAVNEAMACSKAILVSDKVGCATDLVTPGVNGDVFEAKNVASLAEKLSILIKSKALLRQYGANSKKIIKNWNFERSCQVIAEQLRLIQN
jgi:glycosyltransferase involved in cell wall biosynthesis